MNRKSLLLAFAAFSLLLFNYSCSDDGLTGREVEQMINNSLDSQWQIVNVEIKSSDWKWVETEFAGYYEASVNLKELNENVFNDGAAVAYYKFDNNTKTALPFVRTILDHEQVPFTETYSCDFVLGNPSIAVFTFSASDIRIYDPNPPAAEFQIVLIY